MRAWWRRSWLSGMSKMKSAKRIVRASLQATAGFMSLIGGRSTAASGAGYEKADGRVAGRFRVETKCPPTNAYRLTGSEWLKLCLIALRAHEVPVFHLKFSSSELVVLAEKDYLAFGGTTLAGIVEGAPKGYKITEGWWLASRSTHPHMLLAIIECDKTYLLRVMPATDFVSLTRTEDA